MGYNLAFAQQSPPPLGGQTLVDCVSNLQITRFESHKKSHKVVISGTESNLENIIYATKTPNKTAVSYDWKLGEDAGNKGFVNYWGLLPLQPNSFQKEGVAYIPNSKLPDKNDDLGNTHGTAMVIEDGQTPGAIVNDVQVFFRKDDLRPDAQNLLVPNWFYYWSQIPNQQNNINSLKFYNFDSNLWYSGDLLNIDLIYTNEGKYFFDENKLYGEFESVTYGSINNDNTKNISKQRLGGTTKGKGALPWEDGFNYAGKGFLHAPTMKISKACGYYDIGDPENVKGISAFAETFFHELEHWKIFYENWKDGYQSDLDLDNDGYNDEWEKLQDAKYKFTWEHPNWPTIIDDDTYQPNYIFPLEDPKNSSGTYYEEERCRIVQKLYRTALNNKDWSFDPSIKYQGKQWK